MKTMKKDAAQQLRFPWKLHLLLERSDASIVSWMPDGKSFLIHDKERFAEELMPAFFGTTNFKTFQRNLNLW
jgi:HSF-type DNA-binding